MAEGRYAVFLRAINTGRRRIKMADLASAYVDAGFEDVGTFLASGNLILGSESRPDAEAMSSVVLEAFGFESEAFVRSGGEVESIIAANPWPEPDALVEVSFLERSADVEAARALETAVHPPECLVVSGSEVYFLREGKGIETQHKEPTTARILGQKTTRRGMRTVSDLYAKFLTG